MPIDIDLLRSDEEGGILEAFLESQFLRLAAPSLDENESRTPLQTLLTDIQANDAARRSERRDLELQRNSLKALQKSLAPKSKVVVDKDKAKNQIKQLKETIQARHDKLQADDIYIQQNLMLVGNLVDKEIKCGCLESVEPQTADVNIADPVFCLGGYEKVQLEGSTSFTAMSGHMADLARAITMYSISKFKNENFSFVSLPESIPLSAEVAHSLIGCQPRNCEICAGKQQFPSFLAASMMHRGKTYWDRELPMGNVCLTTNQHLWDRREAQRLDTFGHTKRKWFQEVKAEQVTFAGMTVCTLELSRKLQTEIADQIRDLHISLLIAPDFGLGIKNTRQKCMVRTRSVPPSELEPCEVSRIVVEGYLQKGYVSLGTVSNTTDFISRALKTRCGGSHVEYVHSVHATCCSVNETLEWVVQNNVVEVGEELGVVIPPLISSFMGYADGSTVFFPFQRRLYPGKAGRKPVVKELTKSATRTIGKISNPVTREKSPELKETVPFALHRLPNGDEVLAERFISPFDFLPPVLRSESDLK